MDSGPIHIPYAYLEEWLVDRKRVSEDWNERLRSIHEDVATAIHDLPKSDERLSDLLASAELDYFAVLAVTEALKTGDTDSQKNFLGWYSSHRVKAWEAIRKKYENGNVFLCEIASTIRQNVKFEIPYVKQKLNRLQEQFGEMQRKEVELRLRKKEAEETLKTMETRHGIEGGEDLERQIVKKAREDLPIIFEKVVEKCREDGVSQALAYYLSFKRFLAGECKDEDSFVDVLSALRQESDLITLIHVIEHGNARNDSSIGDVGECVSHQAEDHVIVVSEEGKSGEVSGGFSFEGFKMEEEESSIPSAIDLDTSIDSGNEDEQSLQIQWDVPEETSPGAGDDGGPENDHLSIEWMDFADTDVSSCLVISSGEEASETFLESIDHRNEFLNDISQVYAFLESRLSQVVIASELSILDSAHSSIRQTTEEDIRCMASCVKDVMDVLQDAHTQHCLLLCSSTKYVEHIARSVRDARDKITRLAAAHVDLEARRDELSAQIPSTKQRHEALVHRTKQLQTEIEKRLTENLNGRPVMITGDINKI